jgi:hypothetical protein
VAKSSRAPQTHNPANIFVVAEQFRFADKMLNLMLQGDLKLKGAAIPFDVSTPMVTCAAFAFELYLKCLIAMETGSAPPNRHEFDLLFRLLNPTTQKEIQELFDKGGRATIEFIEQQFRQVGKPSPRVDFDYVLKASRRAFPIARYLYEGLPGEQGWVAEVIMESARAVILRRFPHWRRAKQKMPIITRQVP